MAIQLPALESGQTYWLQIATRAAGPISASWTLPVAQSAQLLLYTNNPFAGMANPVSRGPIGKPLVSQNTSNTTNFGITTAPVASAAGIYTVQFFNSSRAIGTTIGMVSYYSDGTACPTSVTGNSIP